MSLPKPYYNDGRGIMIFHGDALEIVPYLMLVKAVITDPPYNVGKQYGEHNDSMSAEEYASWARMRVDACLQIASRQFWVAPRYKMELWMSLLPDSHLVVVPRGASGPFREGWQDQFETALAIGMPNKMTSDLWTGIRLRAEGYFFREETYDHPGTTPYPIMAKAISIFTEPGDLIVDPFCGTGTTLRAAKDLGRKAVGIEIEEKWCEAAVNRLAQEVLIT